MKTSAQKKKSVNVKAASFVNSPAPLPFVSNQLRQPQKSYKPNGTICAGLCWSTFVFLLLYSPNSKVWDLSICPRPTAAHALLSRLMHKHRLNRWIPDGCIGAIRYLSQTTDSGVLFPVTAALMETLSFLMYQLSRLLIVTAKRPSSFYHTDYFQHDLMI